MGNVDNHDNRPDFKNPLSLAFSRDSCYTIVSGIPKVQIQSANFALWNLPNWYPTYFRERRNAFDLFPRTYKPMILWF